VRTIDMTADRRNSMKGKWHDHLTIVAFAETTAGLATGSGGVLRKGTADEVAQEIEINTRKGVERILEAAFAHAEQRGLRRVCMADKANVLVFGHALWRRTFAEVARRHPGIEAKAMSIDALSMDLIRQPGAYEVTVTNNLFGDILTDLGAALTGGL